VARGCANACLAEGPDGLPQLCCFDWDALLTRKVQCMGLQGSGLSSCNAPGRCPAKTNTVALAVRHRGMRHMQVGWVVRGWVGSCALMSMQSGWWLATVSA
jgi:hypothetical protein